MQAVKQPAAGPSNAATTETPMKHLVLTSLFVAVASQSAGCIIYDDTDDPYYDSDATIVGEWSFKNLANNALTGCPSGYDTVRMISQPVDLSGREVGEPYIDLFDCVDMRHATALMPPDVYLVWLEVLDSRDNALYAQSTSQYVDVVERDATFSATILNDGGYFLFDWALRGAQSNDTLSCGEAGDPDSIEILSTLSGTTEAIGDKFNCADGSGITGGLLAGAYTLSVSALDREDRALGTAPALVNEPILDRNRITDLGVITIPIDNR